MDKNEKDFSDKRKSARIPDSFLLNYKIISRMDFEKKAPLYKNRRTVERLKTSRYDTNMFDLDWASLENERDYSPSLTKILSYMDRKLDMILYKQNTILQRIQSPEQKTEEHELGKCADISGNGLKMFLDREIKKETILELSIEPPIYPPLYIAALGKPVRICSKIDEGKKVYEVSVKFNAINEDDREDLIKYIFMRQRKLIALKKNKND